MKLIDEESNETKLSYGIVEDVLNDGERGFVQFNVIKKDYYGVSFSRRVLAANQTKQPAVFPATPEEVKAYFDEAENTILSRIRDAEKNLENNRQILADFRAVRLNESLLSTPKYAA